MLVFYFMFCQSTISDVSKIFKLYIGDDIFGRKIYYDRILVFASIESCWSNDSNKCTQYWFSIPVLIFDFELFWSRGHLTCRNAEMPGTQNFDTGCKMMRKKVWEVRGRCALVFRQSTKNPRGGGLPPSMRIHPGQSAWCFQSPTFRFSSTKLIWSVSSIKTLFEIGLLLSHSVELNRGRRLEKTC